MNNTAILISTTKARRESLLAELDTINKFLALFEKAPAKKATSKATASARSEGMKKAWQTRKKNAAKAEKAAKAANLATPAA